MSSALKSTTVEIANGNTRWVHNNGAMGFLKSDSNWDMYANNSGQIWAANYGWLHDYFFSAINNCAWGVDGARGNCGNTGNCYNSGNCQVTAANCGNIQTTAAILEDSGSTVNLRTYLYNYNCNCNCNCTCK